MMKTKKSIIRIICIGVLALFLVGCASTSTYTPSSQDRWSSWYSGRQQYKFDRIRDGHSRNYRDGDLSYFRYRNIHATFQ